MVLLCICCVCFPERGKRRGEEIITHEGFGSGFKYVFRDVWARWNQRFNLLMGVGGIAGGEERRGFS